MIMERVELNLGKYKSKDLIKSVHKKYSKV